MIHEKKKEKNPRGRRSNGRAITLNEGRRKKTTREEEDEKEFMHDNISPFICKKELNHRYKAQQPA
jgi:hypothetical protein